jgi:hypothetical protein
VSLPSYDEAFEHARDEPAFSNGSMWEIWSDRNCCRCINDGMGTGQDEPQCPLIGVALMGKTPAEWTDQEPPLGAYLCVYFRDRDDPGGREPEPVPDPPGQLCLMPREPYTGTRMYADTRPSDGLPAAAPAGALASST